MSKPYFLPADILLPKNNLEKWSVIACDQYTSEPDYWKETEKTVGECPSAFNIILPEVYLSKDNSKRISSINQYMEKYINDDVFDTYNDTMVYVERKLADGKLRKGIVGLIDLEDYSYKKDADTLIRATEETVTQRIPPRVEIRKDASLELPHIMLLIDDSEKDIIESLSDKAENFTKLYDFTLMQNGGEIKGYKINEKDVLEKNEMVRFRYGAMYERFTKFDFDEE